jgi:6-phosphogluconolactonase
MATFEWISFASDAELARAAAREWLDLVAQAARRGQPLFVALSGGRIARRFFSAVAEGVRTRGIALDGVHFFWADERCVPPGDPASNFAVADQLLFRPLGVASRQIHRIRGEDDPAQAASAAEEELRRLAPSEASRWPRLDLVLLGMGEDGHVASLFPNAAAEPATTATYQAVAGPKPPPRRITLTYGAIAAARDVWVLASGPGKAEALRRSLTSVDATPLARVLAARQRSKIFSDIESGTQFC